MTRAKKNLIVEDSDGLETAIDRAINIINERLKALSTVDSADLDDSSIYKLSNALSGLTRARTEFRKLDALRLEAVIQVRGELQALIRQRLQRYPKLCEQLQEVIAEAETTALTQRP